MGRDAACAWAVSALGVVLCLLRWLLLCRSGAAASATAKHTAAGPTKPPSVQRTAAEPKKPRAVKRKPAAKPQAATKRTRAVKAAA